MPRLIELWDRIARKAIGVRPVAEGSVIGYAIRRYPGRSLTNADGSTLTRGEPVMELHLDSQLLAQKTAGATAHRRIIFLLRELRTALQIMAQLARNDPKLANTRGLWGLTLLHRGFEPLGFTVVDLPPGLTQRITTLYLKWLLAAYHPDGEERLHQREEELVPKELFLSREELLARYG